ncbi:hypothetical protein F5878DRAFT_448580 [Lentinula raphanica]|uniref:PHD-type domain-containing protein n=1 Tax=Lentinula raphanica TaxID=153919 RepID=A0AA38PF05_9AGAR|nr:hypothetical protein F5880DRAFT_1178642 [Lentinula raphanica]KAJ3841704.1 hypothetical protein F5878DRAFT_448580 [Lentinula raphanica]
MVDKFCRRCQGTEHQPSKHLLTCQLCRQSWHHCCHIPMITDSEMSARLKGTIRSMTQSKGDHQETFPLSLENWRCSTCLNSKIRNDREPTILVISSDSDSEGIQFIGQKPSAGLQQAGGSLDTSEREGEVKIRQDVQQDDEVELVHPTPLVNAPTSTKSVAMNQNIQTATTSFHHIGGHRTLLIPRPDPQLHIMKYEVVETALEKMQDSIGSQNIQTIIPSTEGLYSLSTHPTKRPRALSNIISNLRNRANSTSLLATAQRNHTPLALVSPQLRPWFSDQPELLMHPSINHDKELNSHLKSQPRKLKASQFDFENYDPDGISIPEHLNVL